VRLASGAVAAVSGRVDLFGDDVATLAARERARRVAVVPQETHPVFEFTVSEIVRMGRAPHLGFLGLEGPKDRELAHSAMRRCSIDHLADRSFRALSGGEHQRVLLARALTQERRCSCWTSRRRSSTSSTGSSPTTCSCGSATTRDPAIVVVSHDVNLAARYCDRLILMRAGMIVCLGRPRDVLTRAPRSVTRTTWRWRSAPIRPRGGPYVIPLSPR
jgi:iron complex transport system ATP-binding protein